MSEPNESLLDGGCLCLVVNHEEILLGIGTSSNVLGR